MDIDEQHEHHREMRLYNDVMGIALAVWGHNGDCDVFRIMDGALDDFNLGQLAFIKEAFGMMPKTQQRDVMGDIKTIRTESAIARMSENIAMLTKSREARTA